MRNFFFEALQPEHLLFYFFAYALAATPTSYLVAKIIHKVDLRTLPNHAHSGLMLWRTWSKKSGFLVFMLDLAKGVIPCAIAASLDVKIEIIALIGFMAVIGHCFSIWLMFTGGRGAATGAGAMLFIFWPASLLALLVFLFLLFLGFVAERASFYGTLSGIISFSVWTENKFALIGVLAMAVIILLHHKNHVFSARQT
jgi:glycerol-3-phosphate acyltransferase PlsY